MWNGAGSLRKQKLPWEVTESETEENKVEEVKADELISAADLIGVPKNED